MATDSRARAHRQRYCPVFRRRSVAQWLSSARNRARRTLLEPSLRRAYERRAKRHSPNLPLLSAEAQAVLDAVETAGVHTGSVASLNVPGTEELLQSASALLPALAQSPATRPGGFMVQTDQAYFKEFPQLFLWGLNEKVLDLVENYLGVPVGFDGVNINRSIANGMQHGTRLWHLDQQDHRMFRIIIYLNDVDSDNAAFEYIPRQHSEKVRRYLKYSNEMVSDAIMREVAPGDHRQSCVGPRGTAIFADPANVFHRSKVPKSRERFAIFFSYHSAKPMHERYLQPGFLPDSLAGIEDYLTERQRACIFWRK